MGTRKTSKAEIILRGARERFRVAQEAVREAMVQVNIATAGLEAHRDALFQLEKDLAITPRKVKDPKSPAPDVTRRSSQKKEPAPSTASIEGEKGSVTDASKKCAICGSDEVFPDHQKDSPVYHLFRTTLKKKNSKDNGGVVLPDDPTQFQHEATA